MRPTGPHSLILCSRTTSPRMNRSVPARHSPFPNSKEEFLIRGENVEIVQLERSLPLMTASRGGVGIETAAAYINYEFERVFYKLNYGFRATIQNLYMVGYNTNAQEAGVLILRSFLGERTGAILVIQADIRRTMLERPSRRIARLYGRNTAS